MAAQNEIRIGVLETSNQQDHATLFYILTFYDMKTCIQFILCLAFMATSYLHTQNISAGINDAVSSSISISSIDLEDGVNRGNAGAQHDFCCYLLAGSFDQRHARLPDQ